MDDQTWNSAVAQLPGAHILQTWEWARLKENNGWQPLPQTWQKDGETYAAAMVLQRSSSLRLRVLYSPRGPLVDWNQREQRQQVLADLETLARRQGAIFIKIDPEILQGTGVPGEDSERPSENGTEIEAELEQRGWKRSGEQVQFRNTVMIDLSGDEDAWLGRMKQKTRYNIRLAQKKGVVVRQAVLAELPLMYKMYAETSIRDGFVIRPESYYLAIWQEFIQKDMARALIAEVDGQPVAGLVLFFFAKKAWYLYGMSTQEHREKMPNYLLQWEAMRLAKSFGCDQYDLWGAPDHFDETDSMWGVFRFKEGLGGTVMRTPGAWDFPARPWTYYLYTRLLPRLLNWMRRRGKARTRQEAGL
jgi:lipid II:glycine glycyltransferase (peptidoglycan interpeptide bridge formation enzyme)